MPKAKLTKQVIETLPHPEKGQVFYVDKTLPGFYLIVGKQSKTFAVQKDMQGKSVRYTIGRYGHFTPEEARKVAKEKLYLMSTGVNPLEKEREEQAQKITLQTVLEQFLETRRNLKDRTRSDYTYITGKYLADWLARPVEDITKEQVLEKHGRLGRESGPTTANKVLRVFRALYNFAKATYGLQSENPVSYLSHVKAWYKESRRRTYIKPSDLKEWWNGVHDLDNDTYRDFFLVLLFTGLRRGEAAKIAWTDINFAERTLRIPDTKNGDPLVLPICDYLFEMFEQRRARYGNYKYVFPGSGIHGYLAEPKKGIYKVIRNSGVEFTCHDLRRTFITIAESLDIGSYALKRMLNHRVTDVTGGYIIVGVERLRAPMQQIERYILDKVNGKEDILRIRTNTGHS